jgi:hypothetical protein
MNWKAQEWQLNIFSYVIWWSFEIVVVELLSLATSGVNTTVVENAILSA